MVEGSSLVARTAWVAREFRTRCLPNARIVLDTDSSEIAAEGRAWGVEVPFLRPAELAQDNSKTIDSVLVLLDRLEARGEGFESVILLQPTSPLRTVSDIARCWSVFASGAVSVASVTNAAHPPELAVRLSEGGVLTWCDSSRSDGARRQELPHAYTLSGSTYVASAAWLRANRTFVSGGITVGVPLPLSSSVDIDTPEDLEFAEALAVRARQSGLAIGRRQIGDSAPCFLIAEAGVNHNGNVAIAHELINVAADAGADAVKFQTYDPDLVAAPAAAKADYQAADQGASESQLSMLRRLVLPQAAHSELRDHARERGLLFLSTAFDRASADFLEELGVAALKVPSGEITNHGFISYLAKKGLPLLISSGMSTLAELAAAIEVVETSGNPPIALLHCVTSYPAPASECNLRAMSSMRSLFGVPVGWSDHTTGIDISLGSVALGAEILEKHFTLDRNLSGPDHRASLEPGELRALVDGVRSIESARGSGIKVPQPSEAANARVARRSLHAARALSPGHVLSEDDLVALRPASGVSPVRIREVIGMRLARKLAAGEPLHESDLV